MITLILKGRYSGVGAIVFMYLSY